MKKFLTFFCVVEKYIVLLCIDFLIVIVNSFAYLVLLKKLVHAGSRNVMCRTLY